jgi:RHS repeat-associated protein
MTTQTRTKVWDAYVKPYGKAQTFGLASAAHDFRLLGQWHQLEAAAEGLSQNHYRDYDPSIGRYIQADPLGFRGGQSLYAYVDGRPYDDVDTMGLCPMCIGAGADLAWQMIVEGKSLECVDWVSVATSAVTIGKLANFIKLAKPLKKGEMPLVF